MYICTLYTTDHADADYIPAVTIAKGDTLDELVGGIRGELEESFGTDPDGRVVGVTDQYGTKIEDDIEAVCRAFLAGTYCIVVEFIGYRDVYTVQVI